MRILDMSDSNVRNSTRTPNIFQNVELSPTPSSKTSADTTTLSSGGATNTKPKISLKIQTLRQRKIDLDKMLIEKTNLLQQLCREETKLIGCYPSADNILIGIDCNDGSAMTASLRRRVDTSFKLPENLLNNSKEDDINKLLLSKRIQQQISEASLKMANDMSQIKSIRRTHKQNYEMAQQKLLRLNQSLSLLKKQPNIETTDDINIHYSKLSNNNNNNNFATMNTVNLNQDNICSSSSKFTNSNNLNNNNLIVPERRNSAISTSSSQQHLSIKSRPRCDSYSGVGITTDYIGGSSSSGKQSPSPSNLGYYHSHHLHYSNHNHLADKVVYVTNAVVAAAANRENINASLGISSSPKYGRLRKPLTVDTSGNEPYHHYPNSAGYIQRHSQTSYHSPYPKNTINLTQTNSRSIGNASDDDIDDEDDIAGQYATLLTLTNQPTDPLNYHSQQMHQSPVDIQETETHYSVIMNRNPTNMVDTESIQLREKEHQPKNQGLGGYWITSENNERIWYSIDNRYSSLDRKSQKNKIKKQIARSSNQPTKSTSLGNFNFLNKQDEMLDAISVTSVISDQRKATKDKQWVETSLDAPAMKYQSNSPQTISPPIYYRDKNKLSSLSHLMHSPGNIMAATPQTTIPKSHLPPSHVPNRNLNKSLSTSATTLNNSGTSDLPHQQQIFSQLQQPLSPPYYHPQNKPTSLLRSSEIPTVAYLNNYDGSSLRRTSSNVSNGKQLILQNLYSPTNNIIQTSTKTTGIGNNNDSVYSYQGVVSPVGNNNTNTSTSDIHIESPKNITVVQQAKFQPYKEVTKPFEMSDFYKYSTKFRQKTSISAPNEQNSPQLPPKNGTHKHMHSASLSTTFNHT